MKNSLLTICAIAAIMFSADVAFAGGGGGGGKRSDGTVRLRNDAGSQPIRVWLLTEAEVNSLQGNETKQQLIGRFGNGVNLNANRHRDFNRMSPGNYVAIAFHTAAFDAAPNNAQPLMANPDDTGIAQVPIEVTAKSRQRVDFNATVMQNVRMTNYGGPVAY